ncbi:pyridoxamine 5-phosphate oxidase, putative [Bodo saltans]|uniref:pyridoxal 5'-phosphate synthase n=1 Tax=Bodo saltans TaxID=75058 RepID=A0A0S4JSE5_BODSA|nr:pyridoxamine 5-phosphate oxidase, putative [Bodo saltans]|eukprot:CUG93155.1 pyridoxamine 5-phosphate oxidase, putative [Bodo saltans]
MALVTPTVSSALAATLAELKAAGELDLATFNKGESSSVDYSAPFALFSQWYAQAQTTETPWANAVNVATVGANGRPSSRAVLMQMFSVQNGFGFYTNYASRKGREMDENPFVAMTFYWPQLARQVRIEGRVAKASETDSDAYFARRPRGHQISAWSSLQSECLPSADVFTTRIREMEAQFPEGTPVPRPPHCGLYFVTPDAFEFWCEGGNRRHQRLTFSKSDGEALWTIGRLFP